MRRINVVLVVVEYVVVAVAVVVLVLVVMRCCPGKKGRHTGDGNCGDKDDDETPPDVFAPESRMDAPSDSSMGGGNDDDDVVDDGGG
jgi:hypothetical protein